MRAFGFCLVLLLAASLVNHAVAQSVTLADQWATYRGRFIGDDGRVRDTGNKEVSHTEGQGFAMLFAEAFDDRTTFDRVWNWTRDKLRRPDGALFAWRWDPSNQQNPVSDTNNATDGDILIAWSLSLAGHRWHNLVYGHEAHRILDDIRKKLIERIDGHLVLMPGTEGFKAKDGTVMINPSYYIYPALNEFPRIDGSPLWARLRHDGLDLLAKAQFGEWGLTTDWITVGGKGQVQPAAGMPPRFGFDAIRIPLYLIWGREATQQRLAGERRFWDGFTDKPIPAWVDVTNGSVAPFPAPSGFQAIVQLARPQRRDAKPDPLPEIGDKDDYYSSSLILLAGLARQSLGK
jgi:endoglucanase